MAKDNRRIKKEIASNLVIQSKMFYKNAINMDNIELMEMSWNCWCDIHSLYETSENDTEEDILKNSKDLAYIMAKFTDDEVYGITDYGKLKYIMKE